MVNRLIVAVTGQSDITRAWASLVSPQDRVGIKISAAGGELFTTHRDIVNAIADSLTAAGYPRSNIIVWDRSLGGIKEAGYRPEAEGYRMQAIPPRDGYDPQVVFAAPMMGQLVWGDLDFQPVRGKVPLSDDANTSDQSHLARIVSTDVTKIINVPVMSETALSGIAGCLYNVTIPNIDNWRRVGQSTGFGASGIADLYANPLIGGKVVLNVMDGLVAQYAGGPQSQPNYAVHYQTVLASKDPVAIDAIALRQIEEWRRAARLPPLGHLALHVAAAAESGIGNADFSRIDIRKIDR